MLRKLLFAMLAVTVINSTLWQHAYVSAADAFLDTDKDEISLGEDLTIRLAEPDANVDSRSIDRIPLNVLFIDTNKFDETPLDVVLDRTGIRASQSFLRETGFNTGIFEVTLESINSRLVDRGSQIRIIYFDNTPSGGGSPVRIQKVIPVVESKITIVFDKKEYSMFDQIEIKLIAQMFNVNRNKIDTLNTPTGDTVALTTTSGDTYYPPMFETDLNTGIFIGKVQLTPDQNQWDGDLVVTSGDRIRVSILIVPGFEISDSATITATTGSITFDRSEYLVGDEVKVTVIDRDENRNPNVIDTVTVRIWSNTDIAGMELTLQETETSSGVFEGMITLSAKNSADNLLVSDNDVLIAVYNDRTLPSLTEVIASKDLFATAKIGTIRSNIVVSIPSVLEENNLNIESVEAGKQITVRSSITNANAMKETFVYIVHIVDADGLTSQLSFVTGMLEPYQSISVGRSWIPDEKGTYTIEIFTWDNLTAPSVLSPIKKTMIIAK